MPKGQPHLHKGIEVFQIMGVTKFVLYMYIIHNMWLEFHLLNYSTLVACLNVDRIFNILKTTSFTFSVRFVSENPIGNPQRQRKSIRRFRYVFICAFTRSKRHQRQILFGVYRGAKSAKQLFGRTSQVDAITLSLQKCIGRC